MRQIKRSQREAQQANEAKTHFLATMSHELLTPLNGLIGFADFLSGTALTSEQREHLDFIQHCSHSLNTLIRDLLNFSAIESGRIDLEKKTVVLSSFLSRLVEIHRMRASEQGMILRLTVSKQLPETIEIDPSRLQQIIANLLSNALKYSSSGTVEVLAQMEGETLVVLVRDEGRGLPTRDPESLFEPYIRGERKAQSHKEGTGLGLAISRKLCEAMQGSIQARNRPEKGAEFEVRLPIGESSTGSAVNSEPESSSFSRSFSSAEISILVAEDNPVNARLLTLLLSKQGYSVTTACDGEEALQKLQGSADFSVLLADLNMPKRDGLSLARTIRSGDAGQHYLELPIIAVSANLLEADRDKALAAGMNAFVSKPIKPAQLASQLFDLIRPE